LKHINLILDPHLVGFRDKGVMEIEAV